MKKNLVIGAVTNYDMKQIRPWLMSLRNTGYQGHVALVAYNMKKETIDELEALDVTIFGFDRDEHGNLVYPDNPDRSIMVERFAHMWYYLGKIEDDIGYVITTDVRDVVFQTNPDWFINSIQYERILVASENLKYKDEPWNVNNMSKSFGPMIYDMIHDRPIFCCGVIAGPKRMMSDLFLQIFLLCRGSPSHVHGGGGPDQAALNILLYSQVYQNVTIEYDTSNDFACHLGTSVPAITAGSGEIGQSYLRNPLVLDRYKTAMIGNEVKIENNMAVNSRGKPFCIVHQYDRVPVLKEHIEKTYGV